MAEMTLDGRVAVVTGAAGGIGRAIAHRLAVAGADVAVADIDDDGVASVAENVRTSTGRACLPLPLDVGVSSAVEDAIGRTVGDLGRLDVVVAAAGMLRNAPLERTSDAGWDAVIDSHLRGAFLLSRAAAPHLPRGGTIVLMSSAAVAGSDRGQVGYTSAKAGIIGLTRTMAIELGPRGIRVNAVAPGAVATEMTRVTAAERGQSFAAYRLDAARRVPLGRMGEPEDVADVVCFLASPAAAYVSGATIPVAGGPTASLG